MGVSFKVARTGTRYRPKPLQIIGDEEAVEEALRPSELFGEESFKDTERKVSGISDGSVKPRQHLDSNDMEVSFSVNLFQSGFSLGEVSEWLDRAPEQLVPYNKDSVTLFSAIEYGCLPGVLLDDLPSKYVNGSVLCEIRDYRSCSRSFPIVHRVALQMTMENIVNDILSISDDSWTYEDLLEFEARVLKALQPVLNLNPQPLQKKVDLDIQWSWKKKEKPNEPKYQPNESVETPIHRESNTLQRDHSDSRVFTSKLSCNSVEVTSVHDSAEPNKPVNVTMSASTQNARKRTRNQAKQKSPNNENDVKAKRQNRAAPRSSRKPKNDPLEFSTEKTTISEEPHSQNKELDSVLKLLSMPGVTSRAVKPEPVEISHLLDEIVGKSSFASSQNQKPSHASVRTGENHLPNSSRIKNIASKRRITEIIRNESGPMNFPNPRSFTNTAKVKALPLAYPRQNHQGPSVVDRKKRAGMKVDPMMTRLVNQSPVVLDEAVLARLRKVIDVTQSHRMFKKRKPDHYLRNRLNFHQPSDVALHLLNCEISDQFEETFSGKVSSLSEIPVGDSNVIYVRTLIFVYERVFLHQEEEEDKERRVRLVLEKRPNNDVVKGNILYGLQEGFDSNVRSNSHSADLFASQFTSLMAREGYHLSSDEIKPILGPSHELLSNVKFKPRSPPSSLVKGLVSAGQSRVNLGGEFGALTPKMQEITIRRAQLRRELQQRVRNQELVSQGFNYYHRNPPSTSLSESAPSISATLDGRWREAIALRSWIDGGDSVGPDYDPITRFVRRTQ